MKILVSDPVEAICAEILKGEGFLVDIRTGMKAAELQSVIGEYDGLVIRSGTQVTADIVAAAKNMKVIGRAGAGVDNIDCDAATRRGIVVMNTPGGNTISTAEHTLSLLLSLSRNIPQAFESLKQKKWERKKFIGTELLGKTIGIIGLGKIGREVAARCQAFGMTTVGYDPVLAADIASTMDIQLVSLEELFARSDFITVHTPLNDETRGLIGDAQIARCKDGVRLINCARGGILDELALLRGLESGKVGGVALDVFVQEPPERNPLLDHPRVIATPHLGASTEEAQEKVARQIAIQIADFLKDRGISGAVNADVIQMAMRKEIKPYVQLAERLGSLQAQLAEGALKRISVTVVGAQLAHSMELISAAVLKGVLSQRLTEPVNLVNAPLLAKDLGISLGERKEIDGGSYTQLIRVDYESEHGRRRIAGTIFGENHMRVVQLDDFHLEAMPEGHMLFYKNIDKPGMLANVGSILAAEQINIAGLALGRDRPGRRAVTIINVDSPIPLQTLQKLEKIEGVFEVKSAKL
ncbi:MAG: phosphoglycerate dehydrogenase [Ignavibacteriales bacterium]|nr:phosphoglycerate dehydrogenase [Ignavibacteriales bacterium]